VLRDLLIVLGCSAVFVAADYGFRTSGLVALVARSSTALRATYVSVESESPWYICSYDESGAPACVTVEGTPTCVVSR
jgi:hypothetical protein